MSRSVGSRMTCGCTEPRVIPQRLEVGSETAVEVLFHPLKEQVGESVEGMVTLFLDDSRMQRLDLMFTAEVREQAPHAAGLFGQASSSAGSFDQHSVLSNSYPGSTH